MAFKRLIRRSSRLAANLRTNRNLGYATSTLGRSILQCYQKPPVARQLRCHSTQSIVNSETLQPESFDDPEQRILAKAMEHVPTHGK
uniref:Uncharacterized protein n=1 Tax=Hyaloperonospora arabidopsidis (strain Emoy2) TaxID=559515 RepID=M4B3Y6_HYAAE